MNTEDLENFCQENHFFADPIFDQVGVFSCDISQLIAASVASQPPSEVACAGEPQHKKAAI